MRQKIKNKVLENVKLLYGGIKKVIKGFEDGDFLIKDFSKQTEKDDDGSNQPSGNKDKQESEQFEESEEDEEDEKVNLDWLQYGTV